MAKTIAVKKRQPTDATLRNVRAATARQSALARRVTALEAKVATVSLMVEQLLTRLA